MSNNLRFMRKIKIFSYNPEKGVLTITFHTGITQDYSQVSDKVFQRLRSSLNQNKYYDKNIYGIYPVGDSRSNALDDIHRPSVNLVGHKI